MLWEDEDKQKKEDVVPDNVVDLSFRISCKQIPTTHAYELAQALYQVLPWLENEPEIGIHQIHGATTGNGWERPPDGELMHLSKRAKMHLRVPKEKIEDARQVSGETLDIAGYPVEVGEASVKLLNPIQTIFSRYIIGPQDVNEEQFIDWVVEELKQRNINVRKMLCGIGHVISTPDGEIETRSVMIADLDKHTSLSLQETGLGPGRHLGCGIFLPHKGVRAVGETEDKSHFTGT
ncbi:MAG: type I-MYXAN CRISPR-associated protein Cas6/Cmx6 [Gammaproteobacteria bacterium]|jgi:CRISPR-associated protein Cas6